MNIPRLLLFSALVFLGALALAHVPLRPARAEAPLALAASLTITEPETLIQLETQGFSFARLAFGVESIDSTQSLQSVSDFTLIRETLAKDFRELYAGDSKYGIGMSYVHRGFDPAWLSSPLTRFRLGTISNRIDRKAFHPGTCGELRLIYRLAYEMDVQSGRVSSNLPMTVNLVFFLKDDGLECREAAATVVKAFRNRDSMQTLKSLLLPENSKSIEVNVQSVRWPSTIRPDLGGHAEYVLRVFERKEGRLRPALLENTPDVTRLKKDEQLSKKLVQWINDPAVLSEIDRGTALVPKEFLAERAISVTPRGLSRRENRPFTNILRNSLKLELPLDGYRSIRSKNALLRRLDGLSCMGCHQSRSIAGFHALGREPDPKRVIDALAVSLSPHFIEDLPRRKAYLDALLEGKIPSDEREPPDHQQSTGDFGQSCGLGDSGFADWKCAPDFHCEAEDELVGVCMPNRSEVGSLCRLSKVHFSSDLARSAESKSCPAGFVCEGVSVGFPGGMCAGPCRSDEINGTCGAIAVLSSFNNCLGGGGLFEDCAKHSVPALLRVCSDTVACRNDYICAKTSSGKAACLPPYFLLQMRVDGHPLTQVPVTKRLTNRIRSLF